MKFMRQTETGPGPKGCDGVTLEVDPRGFTITYGKLLWDKTGPGQHNCLGGLRVWRVGLPQKTKIGEGGWLVKAGPWLMCHLGW